MHFLGRTGEERVRKAAEHLRRKQLPTGGWAIYEGGPAELSASVKAYFVLKLVGDDPVAPPMARARETILSLGGIEACNSFTRIYLAIFGQCSWDDTPAVPPEIVLLPDSFIFNIYKMSSWSRGIVVPLSIIWAKKPFCAVPDHAAIPELHVPRTVGARLAEPAGAVLARLLHADRRLVQAGGGGGLHALPQARPRGLRILDPRAAGEVRRARRDLPADHQHDHRVPLPRLRPRRPAPRGAGPRAREARDGGRRDPAPPALLLARSGTPRS